MKLHLSITLFMGLLLHGLPAVADVTDGTVLALDRKARNADTDRQDGMGAGVPWKHRYPPI